MLAEYTQIFQYYKIDNMKIPTLLKVAHIKRRANLNINKAKAFLIN